MTTETETKTTSDVRWNGCFWSAVYGKVKMISKDKDALQGVIDRLKQEPDEASEGVCIFTACAVICIALVVAAAAGAWLAGG